MKINYGRFLTLLTRSQCSVRRRTIAGVPTLKLEALGHAEVPKVSGDYESGQSFIHRVFGYRGMVLFGYTVDLKNTRASVEPGFLETNDFVEKNRSAATSPKQTYYQVLIHEDDLLQMRNYMREELTVMSVIHERNEPLVVRGIDHVSHEEIIPYKVLIDKVEPIKNKAFSYFFTEAQVSPTRVEYIPTKHFKTWEERHRLMLGTSAVHRQERDDIRITVIPFFAGVMSPPHSADSADETYYWNYVLRVELLSSHTPMTIRGARITIYTRDGKASTKDCRLIEGQEPRLTPTQKAFQTVTSIDFSVPRGHVWGELRFDRDDGKYFEIKLPQFVLEAIEKPPSS